MLKEFREFALRGNVMDMAVGIIIGAAFGVIVSSLVNDIIMPPIGLILGNLDFSNLFWVIKEGAANPGPYTTPEIAKEAGAVTINYGRFINNIITFIIVAFSIFLIIKVMNNMRRKNEGIPEEAPTVKDCPYCYTHIPIKATKCPSCTADLH